MAFAEYTEHHVKWFLAAQVNKKLVATVFLDKMRSSKFWDGFVPCFQSMPSLGRSSIFLRE